IMYGSLIPLQRSDVLSHLKRRFNTDFTDMKNVIISAVAKYQTVIIQKPVPFFQVVYKKHTLTLDDLSTLADQNWLNDQVMNMYGELIMESAHQEVHFLNSFFHRQLMTKGYDGVKRWTKQVDLFSKSLLLVPVHLEVHWSLYTNISFAFLEVTTSLHLSFFMLSKEKYYHAFSVSHAQHEKLLCLTCFNASSLCVVFLFQYSRCLALSKPLQFSQKDIPKIRKRIYKELCECKLQEEG
uniref:Ubiquitin-like protease family profile domain-containing protein n=1 Tax=Anabas testudineus TaxID=64144 RepID=A0A3Q1K9Z1_ANATE